MNRILRRIHALGQLAKTQVYNLASYLEPRRIVALPMFSQMTGLVLVNAMVPFQAPVLAADTPVAAISLVLTTDSLHEMVSLSERSALKVTVVESKAQEKERIEREEQAKKRTAATKKVAKPIVLDGQRESNRQIVTQLCAETFGADQVSYCLQIVQRESGFNHLAQNPRSTAFGLFQFLDKTWKGYGYAKTDDPTTQTRAGIAYLQKRYGTPQRAMDHHHAYGWY